MTPFSELPLGERFFEVDGAVFVKTGENEIARWDPPRHHPVTKFSFGAVPLSWPVEIVGSTFLGEPGEIWIVQVGGDNYSIKATEEEAQDVVDDLLSATGFDLEEGGDYDIERWEVGEEANDWKTEP